MQTQLKEIKLVLASFMLLMNYNSNFDDTETYYYISYELKIEIFAKVKMSKCYYHYS